MTNPTATIFVPYHALDELIQRGTRAAQPAATAVPAGTLYCVTDDGAILERSTGSIWEAYGPTLWSTGAVRFRYVHSTTTTAPPTGNQVRFNAAHPYTSVTTVWVRNMTTDGVDTHGIMLVLTIGTTVYIQDRSTSAQYAVFTMDGDPIDHTDYVELPVAHKSNGTAIPNLDNVEVVFIRFEA
jgi:hypothetical protein